MPENSQKTPAVAALVVMPSPVRLFGLTGADRLARSFARLGVAADSAPAAQTLIVARGDHAYEERVLKDLAARPATILVSDDAAGRMLAAHGPAELRDVLIALVADAPGQVPHGFATATATQLSGGYNHALRKHEAPLVAPITVDDAVGIERRLFDGAYKGVTDIVTKKVWPWPAFHVTRWCAAAGISPNMVTFVSLLLVIAAYVLFERGMFLPGIAAAWAMCFLDTVDGKLARVTLTSSKWGNVFDHGIDLIHPPFWYFAWWAGLAAGAPEVPGIGAGLLWASLIVNCAGYVLGRLEEGFFIYRFGIEIHTWRPVDSWFRLITARRNPNLIILMAAAALDAPGAGFVLVAAWTILSFLFHAWRILTALRTARRQPLRSWLADAARPAQ